MTVTTPAFSQTPDSLFAVSYQGQSRLRLNINGGFFLGGDVDPFTSAGGIPAEGSGTRLIWYPTKAAFRAGYINGTQWDDANIGIYSVAIGQNVRASGDNATAFGVRSTAANGSSFAVGEDNTASGYASVALGYHAHTNSRRGSFVFGDNVTGGSLDTIRAELVGQAVWRVSCGMRIYTNQSLTTGVSFGGPAVNPSVCGYNYYWSQPDAMISTSTGAYLHLNGTWTNNSDVRRKHRFEDISGEAVLARLRQLPITSWTYRVERDGARHIGPMAQDFHRAFRLGSDSTTISTVDADGVALAGVQALDVRTNDMKVEIVALKEELAEMRAERAALLERLKKLEELIEKQ